MSYFVVNFSNSSTILYLLSYIIISYIMLLYHIYYDIYYVILFSISADVEIAVGHRKYPIQMLKPPVTLRQKL